MTRSRQEVRKARKVELSEKLQRCIVARTLCSPEGSGQATKVTQSSNQNSKGRCASGRVPFFRFQASEPLKNDFETNILKVERKQCCFKGPVISRLHQRFSLSNYFLFMQISLTFKENRSSSFNICSLLGIYLAQLKCQLHKTNATFQLVFFQSHL